MKCPVTSEIYGRIPSSMWTPMITIKLSHQLWNIRRKPQLPLRWSPQPAREAEEVKEEEEEEEAMPWTLFLQSDKKWHAILVKEKQNVKQLLTRYYRKTLHSYTPHFTLHFIFTPLQSPPTPLQSPPTPLQSPPSPLLPLLTLDLLPLHLLTILQPSVLLNSWALPINTRTHVFGVRIGGGVGGHYLLLSNLIFPILSC